MVEPAKAGLVDLERELTCSICTEVLYQPLTLLDCLHTFCGSCLKEWFSWQASQASVSKPNPFTCPSCRASVRETRPNAGITTLLEMYLQANPHKGRGQPEREKLQERYKPGENVLPRIKRRKERDDEIEDRRMVEEVREMSLQEVGLRGSGSYERGVRHRVRERARGGRDEIAIQQRGNSGSQSNEGEVDRPSTASDAASRARQIGHQSSLRSLISSSDLNSLGIEEEILRQIMDEGILDGIDLNNIDVSQEDELSEKIADAYRRRHGQRSRARTREAQAERASPSGSRERRTTPERQHRRSGRSPNPADHSPHASHPPVSRPHLLTVYPTDQRHRRRSSSDSRRQTSPIPRSSSRRPTTETHREAARSATDLTSVAVVHSGHRVRPGDLSTNNRRTTDPENPRSRRTSRDQGGQTPRDTNHRPVAPQASPSSATPIEVSLSSRISGPNAPETELRPAGSNHQPIVHQGVKPSATSRDLSDSTESPATYSEPSISCERCGKRAIEYDVHWNCLQCNQGSFHLCSHCYRTGRGCLHWYGFGYAAMQKYRSQEPFAGYGVDVSPPHRLKGQRYLRPALERSSSASSRKESITSSDPKKRLQSGPFCSHCSRFTPECYWKCEVCNEGEWGFCNYCVNQGKCCTHALLPTAYASSDGRFDALSASGSQHSSAVPIEYPQASSVHPLLRNPMVEESCTPLTFSTKCDICTYPIPPSTTRLHCPQCNEGDYDIDATCYQRLILNGKISRENGSKGWRRCPNGHRMTVIGFEDSSVGQRRIVVEDLVGGHALKDDVNADGDLQWSWREGQHQQAKTVSKASMGRANRTSPTDTTQPLLKRYPPNGGVGMHVLALWSWWPQEGADDELAFPKGAEIRECEDINGDWFWGIYCARKGLFPSNYGRIVRTTSMTL